MTVCIAAQFKLDKPYVDEPTPAFVLCTDGRLSEAEWGSNDAGIKTHTIGYNFVGLMAGHWSTIRDMCAELETHIQGGNRPQSRAEALHTIKIGVCLFCASSLCPENASCESLITGFVNRVPLIVYVRIDNKTPTVEIRHDHSTIGEGSLLAESMLKHRGYDAVNVDLASACYLVYEAKRFSESVDSVGPKTWLKIHAPVQHHPAGKEKEAFMLMDISDKGREELEEWRKRFFLQSIAELKGRSFRRFQ